MIKHLSFLLLKSAVVLKADVNIDCRVDALHLRVVGILPQAEIIVECQARCGIPRARTQNP